MKRSMNFFPGRMSVSFRKGPSGHLRQDSSDEAMKIQKNSLLQDRSLPQSHDTVRTNALTEVFQSGDDVSDCLEVTGDYTWQFEKYKGKRFRAKDTWKQIWESKADGYVDFILRVKCIPNSKMFKLQQYSPVQLQLQPQLHKLSLCHYPSL